MRPRHALALVGWSCSDWQVREHRNRWVRQVRCRKGAGIDRPFLFATSLSTTVFLLAHCARAKEWSTTQRTNFVNKP